MSEYSNSQMILVKSEASNSQSRMYTASHFSFPITLEKGRRFHSVKEILDFLDGQADERNMPNCTSIYKVHRSSSRIWLQCKVCDSHLNFNKDANRDCFVTGRVGMMHDHNDRQREIAQTKLLKRQMQSKESQRRWKQKIEESRRDYPHLLELSASRMRTSTAARLVSQIKQEDNAAVKQEEVKVEQPLVQQPLENPLQEAFAVVQVKAQSLEFKPAQEWNQSLDNLFKLEAESEAELASQQPIEIDFEGTFNDWAKEHRGQHRTQCYWANVDSSKGCSKLQSKASPGAFLLVSESMVQNYNNHSELLCLTLIPGLVEEESRNYQVVLLSVGDSNMRPLIAGAAVFQQSAESPIYKLLRSFFEMHKTKPRSIVSADSPAVLKGFQDLRHSGLFNGGYLLHPISVITEATRPLEHKIKTKELSKLKEALIQAATTREPFIFKQVISELQEGTFSALTSELLTTKTEMFYCRTGLHYVGLGLDSCREVEDLVRKYFNPRLSLSQFLVAIVQFEAILIRNSQRSFEAFRGNMELHMNDRRLADIKNNFESKVVTRFVENYLKALRECSVKEKEGTAGVMVVNDYHQQYDTSLSQCMCKCNELNKTGVACPHLIAAAIEDEETSYVSLICSKWRKEKRKREDAV